MIFAVFYTLIFHFCINPNCLQKRKLSDLDKIFNMHIIDLKTLLLYKYRLY